MGLILAFIGFLCIQCLPIRFYEKVSGLLFVGTLCLTFCLLFLPSGIMIHGARRWLFLYGISFQPSEYVKLWLLIYISAILSQQRTSEKKVLLKIVLASSAAAAALLLQPDFGTACVLIGTIMLVYFSARCPWRYIFLSLLSSIPIICGLIVYYPYRVKRILTFLDPWQDPQGAGFQIIQSLIAIGSGGFSGLGISHSKQKFFYLPMQHTDFIFSIIAEETGFLGSTTIIMLYLACLYLGIRITHKIQNPFGKLCMLSFTFLIALQSLINCAVVTGLVPTKGIGLPFVSYGNSSLIAYVLFFGIITRIIRHELNALRRGTYQRFAKPLIDFA